jgi:purine-cytosine permease-like protein
MKSQNLFNGRTPINIGNQSDYLREFVKKPVAHNKSQLIAWVMAIVKVIGLKLPGVLLMTVGLLWAAMHQPYFWKEDMPVMNWLAFVAIAIGFAMWECSKVKV